jgi:hypothetical protein
MYPLLVSDFNKIHLFLTNYGEALKYQISQKSVQWEPNCSVLTDRYDEAYSRFSEGCERS